MDSYTISNTKGVYTINNSTILGEDLTISVSKKTCQSVGWEELPIITLAPGEEEELDLREGFFKIVFKYFIEEENEEQEIELVERQDTIYIKNYLKTLQSLMKDLYKIFCGIEEKNPCNNCEETWDSCHLILTAQYKMEILKRSLHPNISPFLNASYALTNCYNKKLVDCEEDKNTIQGKYVSPEKLITKFLALDYIALYLYYTRISNNPLSISEEEVKEIFNSNKILCCIENNIGILLSDIEVPMATFTINTESLVNFPPSVVGDYELNVTTEMESQILTSAMFTFETTPPYQDPENDPPFKLRIDTLPEEGTLIFDGQPVVIGQEILFSDIDLELLVYQVNQSLVENNTTSFTFSVSDTGSEQFTS